MVVRSSTRVDSPIMESIEIWAFWSIRARVLGSVGSEYVAPSRN
jgi:hypothetical protein